jgi:hypothetical protein
MPRPAPRLLRTVAVAGCAVACLTLASLGQPAQPAQSGQPTAPPPPRDRGPGPEQPAFRSVESAMKATERGMKALEAQLKSPDSKDQALKTIWNIQRSALAAKSMEPRHLKGGPTPQNLAGYRKGQIHLMTLLLQLEAQVMDDQTADAMKTYAAIAAFADEAHAKFAESE